MSKDYGSWSLDQIKAELKKRNAKVTGKKAILVQRLQDYDQLFGDLVNNPGSSYKINVPDHRNFLDITSETIAPLIEDQDLVRYCILAERQNVDTSANMYQEEFLLTSRLAYDDIEGVFFVTGICASEMRKNVQYNIVLKLQDHLILEAECECAAGMGPHAQCKHVLVLLNGLVDFNKNKLIRRRHTCTDSLQSFHHPKKPYTGNPVQAENIVVRKNETFKNITKFDPRPMHVCPSKENFTKQFLNTVTNYCATSQTTFPFMQLVKSANKKALCSDHDYLETTAEEKFFECLMLSDDERKNLENKTRSNKKVWKQERLKRMHSSDFGRICKSKETTKKKLAKTLMKNVDLNVAAIKHGIKFEEKAVLSFEQKTGFKTQPCGIIVHEKHQFLGSTPDRLVGEDAVLEVKCPFKNRNNMISPENIPYLYLCEKTGNLKLHENHEYYYQVQGQLFVSQRKLAYFCVYTHKDFKIVEIARDETFIQKMLEELIEFNNKYFKTALLKKYFYNLK